MARLQKNITKPMAISLLFLLGQVIPVFAGLDHREHPDAPETYRQFRKSLASAKKGDAYSQYVTCLAYYTGRLLLVKENFDKAVDWCSQAASQGLVKAQFYLGYFYLHGRFGTPFYNRKAQSWLQLPERYDHAKALYWLELAAKQDFSRAQYHLGFMYEKGLGVNASHKTALYWYQRASKGNWWEAREALKRYQRFENYLTKMAQGDFDAKEEACKICLRGEIAKEKCSEAMTWGIAAAHHRTRTGQRAWWIYNDLGEIYLQGKITRYGLTIPIDYEKARYWLQLAAEQDHSPSQYKLGMMYEQGLGVSKDLEQAKHWYQLAANKGNRHAIGALKELNK